MPPHLKLDAPVAARLAVKLRALRAELTDADGRPMSQERVALAAGVNPNHYQLLESGLSDRSKQSPSNPTLATLIALCDVYGVSVVDLLADVLSTTSERRVRAAVDISVSGESPRVKSSKRAHRG